MNAIRYWASSQLWLSLESFHNAGLTPEQTKAAIEKIPDPGSTLMLRCEPMGINGNWIVRTGCNDPRDHREIVIEITDRLNSLLANGGDDVQGRTE